MKKLELTNAEKEMTVLAFELLRERGSKKTKRMRINTELYLKESERKSIILMKP
jgi:hypothetical protein